MTDNDARRKEDSTDNKDWAFVQMIYKQLRDIEEGHEKDDLQLNIHRLINETKRKISRQSSAGAAQSFSPNFTSNQHQYGVPPELPYYQHNPGAGFEERYGGYASTTDLYRPIYGRGFDSTSGFYRPPQMMPEMGQQRMASVSRESPKSFSTPGLYRSPQMMHEMGQQLLRSVSRDSSVSVNVTSPQSLTDPGCSDADEGEAIASAVLRNM